MDPSWALDNKLMTMLNFWIMLRRMTIILLIFATLLPPLLGIHDFSALRNILGPNTQIPCNATQRDPQTPDCPNCVSLEESFDPFLYEYMEASQVKVFTPSIPLVPQVLLDQGYVQSIFRPPASIL